VRTNVDGTRRLLAAARAADVARFVHVSSPSVAHAGDALVGVGAGPADPARARGHYARSKALAERAVLDENAELACTDAELAYRGAPARPAVVVVRPHLVWGPGDTQLVGRIVARARAGRLAVVGTGAALIDTTYIDDAVDALVAALDRAPGLHGRVLVVSGGEPRPVAELLASICAAAGAPAPRLAVPARLARVAGAVAETLLRHDPPMTRFLAEQLSTAHWFDQRETRTALGWAPRVGLDEGFRRLHAAGMC
ncbi:MAG: NAD-dependent epimerase/dehydratase family protein, partial [Pseudonocardia sp.]